MLENPRRPARAALLALAATLLLGAEALAQGAETDGVRINGTVNTQVSVSNSANVAAGFASRARTDVGSVGGIGGGVSVNGSLNITVRTGPIATQAAGIGAEAITSVGSVEEDVAGQTNVVVSTGQIVNATDRIGGRPACVVVGTLGRVPGC